MVRKRPLVSFPERVHFTGSARLRGHAANRAICNIYVSYFGARTRSCAAEAEYIIFQWEVSEGFQFQAP